VIVRVNDKEVPFIMKVGETGEAFFIFETTEDVPADMQTSPLAEPVADGPPASEPDFLDLNSSLPAAPPADSSEGHVEDMADPNSGGSSLLQSTAARVAGVGIGLVSTVAGPSKLVPVIRRKLSKRRARQAANDVEEDTSGDIDEGLEHGQVSEEVQRLEAHMRAAQSGDLDLSHRDSEGREVRDALRRKQMGMAESDLATYDSDDPFLPSTSEAPLFSPGAESRGDLMLDMAGYKVKQEDQSKAKAIQSSLLSREIAQGSDHKIRPCFSSLPFPSSDCWLDRRRPGSFYTGPSAELGRPQGQDGRFGPGRGLSTT
jgi:phosphatidate phosphatase LPIN